MQDKPSRTLQRFFFAPIVLVPILFVGWLVYCSWHVQDRYREGEQFTADMRRMETEFRQYFHGRKDYPAYPMNALENSKILTAETSAFIASHSGKYVPFSPATPDDTLVLTIRENLFSSWDLTKDELTREPMLQGTPAPAKP